MRVLALLLSVWMGLALALPVEAGDHAGPVIPKATGEPHPEGNAYMRRWHMTMMTHDRDLTMYQGVRPAESSLGGCFACHTARDAAGVPVTAEDDRNFCTACHVYVAVRVDCFQCHRSTPEDFEEPELRAMSAPQSAPLGPERGDIGTVRAYLTTLLSESKP